MRVLIADDHEDSARSLAGLVSAWGFDPVIVHDGAAALSFLREPGGPALALLDWVMPGINGIDVCREIRKDGHSAPYTYVIMVTGQASKQQMLDGLKAGADDYLVKPVDPNELCARLRTATRILELQEQLLSSQRRLHEQATRDSLTGLWNRGMILETLQRELKRSRREGHSVAVIMADIDHFKQINDNYGHLAGDSVLRNTAQRLLAVLRPYDLVGRYGGEEFLVILPGCGPRAVSALAERLRQCIATEPVTDDDHAMSVTVSLGVAVGDGELPAEELIRAADSALYEAKRSGRNRVVGADSAVAGHTR